MRKGTGAVTYLFGDHLGSTSKTYTRNSDNTIAVTEQRYYPWGATRYSSGGAAPTAFQYTGQRNDSNIGLYFYNARYYDLALGRFIQADSIIPNPGDPQAFNRYSYTLNNPLKYTDPSGHFFLLALGLGLAGGAIGGAIYGYGSQVVGNLQQGMNLGQALTTDIDSGEVLKYTGFGTAIGGAGGLVVGAVGEALIAAGLVKTAKTGATLACADGDCTNEIRGGAQVLQNAACGGDCSDEVTSAGQHVIQTTTRQLQHTFKHAGDFGLSGNWSKPMEQKFLETLQTHVNGANTVTIEGTYRGTEQVVHYFDATTGCDVMLDLQGNLVGAWQLSQKQIEYLLSNGNVQ